MGPSKACTLSVEGGQSLVRVAHSRILRSVLNKFPLLHLTLCRLLNSLFMTTKILDPVSVCNTNPHYLVSPPNVTLKTFSAIDYSSKENCFSHF